MALALKQNARSWWNFEDAPTTVHGSDGGGGSVTTLSNFYHIYHTAVANSGGDNRVLILVYNPNLTAPTASGLTFASLGNGVYWAYSATAVNVTVNIHNFLYERRHYDPELGLVGGYANYNEVRMMVWSGVKVGTPNFVTSNKSGTAFNATITGLETTSRLASFGAVFPDLTGATINNTPPETNASIYYFAGPDIEGGTVEGTIFQTYLTAATGATSYNMGVSAAATGALTIVEIREYLATAPGTMIVNKAGWYKVSTFLEYNNSGVDIDIRASQNGSGLTETALFAANSATLTNPKTASYIYQFAAGDSVGIQMKQSGAGPTTLSNIRARVMVERVS
jgi:hypothetical protein